MKAKVIFLIFLFVLPILITAQDRVLVISGGGARGAWGGGLAQALYESGNEYKAVIGTSTGSLLAPLTVIDSFAMLKHAYTSVTHKDIFNVRPFKTKGKKKGQIRGFNAFWRIITGRKTLGESKRLKRNIETYFTPEVYEKINRSPDSLQVIATVVNIETDFVEYKSTRDFSYEDMVNWIWASANQPVFMSLYKHKEGNKEKSYYVDGGVKENVPVRKAINVAREIGATHIDVIIHSTDMPRLDRLPNLRVLKLLGRTIDLFSTEVRENDVDIARLLGEFTVVQNGSARQRALASPSGVRITIYYMPAEDYNLIPNSLVFERKDMATLWDRGYSFFGMPDWEKYSFEYVIDQGNIVPIDLPISLIYKDDGEK